jgi:hypothetical protein
MNSWLLLLFFVVTMTLQIRAKEEMIEAFQNQRDEAGLSSAEYLMKLMKDAQEKEALAKANAELTARLRELETLQTSLNKGPIRIGTSEVGKSEQKKRKNATKKVFSLLNTIHGKTTKDVGAGIGDFLIGHPEIHDATVNWLDQKTNYSEVMQDRFPHKKMPLDRTLEIIDQGSTNVSGMRVLRKELVLFYFFLLRKSHSPRINSSL